MRSRASILPRSCWRSIEASLPGWRAASLRLASCSRRSVNGCSVTRVRLVRPLLRQRFGPGHQFGGVEPVADGGELGGRAGPPPVVDRAHVAVAVEGGETAEEQCRLE